MSAIETSLVVVIALVALALAFDFMNGFHDAANSIATVVSTGVLKPHQAVAWAALFNFLAIAIFELKVAAMVSKAGVEPLLLPGILKIGIFILAAPLIGFAWSALLITAVSWLCFRSAPH